MEPPSSSDHACHRPAHPVDFVPEPGASKPIGLSRRQALTGIAGTGLAMLAFGSIAAPALAGQAIDVPARAGRGLPHQEIDPNPISLAQWSLHRTIRDGRLDPLDFPVRARRLGIGAVEYVNTFYRPLRSRSAWVSDLRRRADSEGVSSLLIMCDGEGDLGDPARAARSRAVSNHRPWLEAASALGCHAIRVNARSVGTPIEQQQRLTEGLAALADLALHYRLQVLVENHGGQSSQGDWLARCLTATGRPNLGSLPDFGNFRIDEVSFSDRYAGVAALMPLAGAVSAKSYDFDRSGQETTIDYPRMLAIVRATGYRGSVGIEYEGRRLAEEAGILATKALLERCGCRS